MMEINEMKSVGSTLVTEIHQNIHNIKWPTSNITSVMEIPDARLLPKDLIQNNNKVNGQANNQVGNSKVMTVI